MNYKTVILTALTLFIGFFASNLLANDQSNVGGNSANLKGKGVKTANAEPTPTIDPAIVSPWEILQLSTKASLLTAQELKTLNLDPKDKTNRLIIATFRKVAASLKLCSVSISLANRDFLRAFSKLRQASRELEIIINKVQAPNEQLFDRLKKLISLSSYLGDKFGIEASRRRSGGALSDKEKLLLSKIKNRLLTVKHMLSSFLDFIQKERLSVNSNIINRLNSLLQIISSEIELNPTLKSFCDLLIAIDNLKGEWQGITYFLSNSVKLTYIPLDAEIDTLDNVSHNAYTFSEFEPRWDLYSDKFKLEDQQILETITELKNIQLTTEEEVQLSEYLDKTLFAEPIGDDIELAFGLEN
ncbi:MAG TPA: hypothetical protein PKD37_02220 [Oligoflexia bacterium]|nr:hypothetical protein [Oligoflexia bacterium]HMP26787.1 hypothetical protein [Oligoflexia bacterium]